MGISGVTGALGAAGATIAIGFLARRVGLRHALLIAPLAFMAFGLLSAAWILLKKPAPMALLRRVFGQATKANYVNPDG